MSDETTAPAETTETTETTETAEPIKSFPENDDDLDYQTIKDKIEGADDAEPDDEDATPDPDDGEPEPDAEPETDEVPEPEPEAEAEPETTVELDDETVERAFAAGLNPDEIMLAAKSNTLMARIESEERRTQRVEMPSIDDIQLELPEDFVQEYGTEMGDVLRSALPKYVESVVKAALGPVFEHQERVRLAAVEEAAMRRQQEIDKFWTDSADPETFGSVPTGELDADSPQLMSRYEAMEYADHLRVGAEARGQRVPTWTEALGRAAKMIGGGSGPKNASAQKRSDTPRDPKGRFAGRPASRSSTPEAKADWKKELADKIRDAGGL